MKNNLLKYIPLLIVICILTLPFHWIPSEKMIVPKKTLSFDKTYVSEEEVREIIEKYYLGSPIEKMEIKNDPLTEKLKDRWKVYKEGNDTFYHHLE